MFVGAMKDEISRLRLLLDLLMEEYERLLAEQEKLLRNMKVNGYTIKEINGHRYVYTWKYLGREGGKDRYKWKCLGRADRINAELIRESRVKTMLAEHEKLENKKEILLTTIRSVLKTLEGLIEKLNCVKDSK